jgi:DNA repair ATPase RecN
MIEVKIKNIGPIQEAEFTIKGVTLLTGESGAGKSSLISALKGTIQNRFPSSLLRFGEKSSLTQLTIGEETVSWHKKEKSSADITFRSERLSKTSKWKIEELEDFLNMAPLQLGNEKVNIHFTDQFEAPLIKNFSHRKLSDVLSTSSEVDRTNNLIRRVREEGLKATGSFNTLNNLINETKIRIEKLSKLVQIGNESKQEITLKIEESQNLKTKQLLLQELVRLLEKANELEGRIKELEDLIESLKQVLGQKQRLIHLEQVVNAFNQGVQIKARIDQINDLITTYQQYRVAKDRSEDLHICVSRWGRCQTISERLIQIKRFTEDKICPICNTKIK